MGKRRQKQLCLHGKPSRTKSAISLCGFNLSSSTSAASISNLQDFYLQLVVGLLLGGVKLNSNYIFHSGSDQRKQTVGVIVVLLKIRAKQQRDNQSFSWAISLIMLLLCCLCASKCGQFGLSCKHGKILLSGNKPQLKRS